MRHATHAAAQHHGTLFMMRPVYLADTLSAMERVKADADDKPTVGILCYVFDMVYGVEFGEFRLLADTFEPIKSMGFQRPIQEEIKIEKVAVFVNPFAEVDAQRAEEDRARKEAAAMAAAKPQVKELVVCTGRTSVVVPP